jgi:hypothetical protein
LRGINELLENSVRFIGGNVWCADILRAFAATDASSHGRRSLQNAGI